MRIWLSIVAVLLTAGSAWAASRDVHYGPAGAWVAPPPTPTATEAPDGAPARIIYSESQTRLSNDGSEFYVAYRMKILRPEALTAGNLAITWSPSTDDFTVHGLKIIRDGQAIDVLATEKFKVVQRENYLEYAVLDGDLTANLQTPGLRVGDELEFAATIRRRDPTLADRFQGVMMLPGVGAPGVTRMRLLWPRKSAVRWRATPDMGTLTPVTQGSEALLSYELRDPKSVILAEGAPARFNQRRTLQFSSFASWGEVSTLVWPLYEKAAELPANSPVRAEAAKIAAATTDPVQRTEAALRLVQEQIRYVYVGLNDSNYRPASAEETWSRRFGDCKAKTVLLLALLRELGVAAEPALVNAQGGDGIDERLPTLDAFNHVLVRATIAGKAYWLDGTRLGDRRLASLTPPIFVWALPLRKGETALLAVKPEAQVRPQVGHLLEIDARAGFGSLAKVRAEQVLRGEAAIALTTSLSAMSAEDSDRALKAYWRHTLDWVLPDAAAWRYDESRATVVLTMTGDGQVEWDGDDENGRYYDIPNAGFSAPSPFRRPKEQDQTAPWVVGFPSYERWTTVIRLPTVEKWRWDTRIPPMHSYLGGVHYMRSATLRDGILRVTASRRATVPEITAAQAQEANATLPKFDDKIPRVAQLPADTPDRDDPRFLAWAEQNATGLQPIAFAVRAMETQRYDQAIRFFDRALMLDPENKAAYGGKSMALQLTGDGEAALKVIDDALARYPGPELEVSRAGLLIANGRRQEGMAILDRLVATFPDDPRVMAAVAGIRARAEDHEGAIAAATTGLKVAPMMPDLWIARGSAEFALGRYEAAVTHYDEALRLNPENLAVIGWRAHALRRLGRLEEALADAEEASRIDPVAVGVWSLRAKVLASLGRKDEAVAVFDDWVTSDTSGVALNGRCWQRGLMNVDLAKAEVDCAAAVKLAPAQAAYWDSYALVALRSGRLPEAVARYDHALNLNQRLAPSLYGRGIAKLAAHDAAGGRADIAAAKAIDPRVAEELTEAGVTPSN